MAEKYSTQQIIDALVKVNGMVYLAARVLGCTPQTIYNRAKRTQSIRDAIDNSRGELVDLAEQKFRAAIMNGEGWAIAMALKTLGKNRGYVERQEMTGADGGPIKFDLARLTDEQLELLVAGKKVSLDDGDITA